MASLPIVMCSYNYKFLFQPQKGEISSITKWSKILPVIALLNEGPEYHQQASQQTVGYAHQMIDAGADFLVGNGTHWVQNTEVYKGKLIVYSLGNFIFDQLDYNGRIALNLSVSLTIPNNNNVSSWLKYAKQCQAAGDGCLALAQNKGLKRFDASYKFDAVGSYGGDRVVTSRANTSQQADIEKIANWQQTLKQLGQ